MCGRLAAASAGLSHRRALDLQVGLVSAGRGAGAHALLDLGRHGHEGLLHVGGVLGAGLQEGDGQGISKLLHGEDGRLKTEDRKVRQSRTDTFYKTPYKPLIIINHFSLQVTLVFCS